jgi:hypothetical protein
MIGADPPSACLRPPYVPLFRWPIGRGAAPGVDSYRPFWPLLLVAQRRRNILF